MINSRFNWSSFFIRFLFALVLVYASYNPSGYSYFHWLKGDAAILTPPFAMASVVLLTGWVIFLRATLRSLGGLGLALAFTFFAILVWWLEDIGLIGINSFSVFGYVILFLITLVLTVGMSWSHVRRRLSGQLDIDDVDEQ